MFKTSILLHSVHHFLTPVVTESEALFYERNSFSLALLVLSLLSSTMIYLTHQEDFPLDRRAFQNLAVGAAGMATAFVYFHFRETGVQVSWKDFVDRYLSRGLVRDMEHFIFTFVSVSTQYVLVISAQVGRMEVVNKEYVKAFPADGVNSSEVVSNEVLLFKMLYK